jgi:threonine dehydratase
MHPDYLEKILNAQVYDVAVETPLDAGAQPFGAYRQPDPVQARRHATGVFLQAARGLQQDCPTFAERLKRGVICASAGNHAQGVALSAAKVGCRAVIVMPTTTPAIKIQAVRNRGGEVVLAGDSYDEAYAHALELEKAQKLTFVHPFRRS